MRVNSLADSLFPQRLTREWNGVQLHEEERDYKLRLEKRVWGDGEGKVDDNPPKYKIRLDGKYRAFFTLIYLEKAKNLPRGVSVELDEQGRKFYIEIRIVVSDRQNDRKT